MAATVNVDIHITSLLLTRYFDLKTNPSTDKLPSQLKRRDDEEDAAIMYYTAIFFV